jgi:hypothetical protein
MEVYNVVNLSSIKVANRDKFYFSIFLMLPLFVHLFILYALKMTKIAMKMSEVRDDDSMQWH